MENDNLSIVESLTICNFCKRKFNASDQCPKILQCKHFFCLKCIETTMVKGQSVRCVDCWKDEIVDGGPSSLPTHSPLIALTNHLTALHLSDKENKKDAPACTAHRQTWTLWCHTCRVPLCRMCYFLIEHSDHNVISYSEATKLFVSGAQLELTATIKLRDDIQRLIKHQREFQLRVLEACVTLKTLVETELTTSSNGTDSMNLPPRIQTEFLISTSPVEAQALFSNAAAEKKRMELIHQEIMQVSKIEDAITASAHLLDFNGLTSQTCDWLSRGPVSPHLNTNPGSLILLANYCLYKLYSLQVSSQPLSPPSLIRTPVAVFPRYYFDIDSDQVYIGRFVIETRPDLAPKMSRNFEALCLGENGHTYKNCSVFQCWEGESIITGDYELNNGRGGRSIYDDGYFVPDETKMAPARGAVGMRRTQKRLDNFGQVGSQFRIILRDMRGFSAIFGQVIEGIELVEQIAKCGDHTGKPTKNIVIKACGKL